MCVSTSRRIALIPSGSLTPSWPSTMKPRGRTWRTSRFEGIETARATSVARLMSSRVTSRVWPLTATAPREFCDLDVLAADADEGPVDLPAGQALGVLDRAGDRMDRLVDVDDDALLEPGRRHGALADDRDAAVAAHLADERDDLRRADVDPDQDRFSFHCSSSSLASWPAHPARCRRDCAAQSRSQVSPDERHVLEDPGPEGDQGHEVEVQAEPVADEGEQHGHAGIGDEPADEDAIVVDAVEFRANRAEDRVQRRHDRHRRVPGELEADVDVEDQAGRHPQEKACQGKKHSLFPSQPRSDGVAEVRLERRWAKGTTSGRPSVPGPGRGRHHLAIIGSRRSR